MKCPHCTVSFHEELSYKSLGWDDEYSWNVSHCICPACKKMIIGVYNGANNSWIVYPKSLSRGPIPVEVDDVSVISDYTEACLVLSDSPKASAALSRRSLQYILREKVKVKHADLSVEIQEVIDKNLLPADLAENLDIIRNVGNFAAHPIKSKSTGEIVEVEPGEAEWNLEVLEELIEYTFVRPAKSRERKELLNIKLADAGKPTIYKH